MTGNGRPHVLLVDDEEIFLRMGRVLAEQAGVEMTFVDSGRVAVETALARRFDLILMDVSMPTVDGPGATRMIRKMEAEAGLPRTPIVALTSFVPWRIKEEMREVGMDEVVAKPIDLETLQALLALRPGGEVSKSPLPKEKGEAIDLSDLQLLCVTDRNMRELLDAFREGVAASHKVMEKGLAGNDRGARLRAAHSLKGLYAQVGGVAGARLMEEIESHAREGLDDEIPPLWEGSFPARQRIWEAVERYMIDRGLLAE